MESARGTVAAEERSQALRLLGESTRQKQALWHVAPILTWLASEKNYRISTALMDLADATMRVNLAMDSLQADPDIQDDLRALFAYSARHSCVSNIRSV